MKLINSLNINTSDMSAVGQSRIFQVRGSDDAVFSLRVTTVGGKFYNFKTRAFDAIETSSCRMSNQVLDSGVFSGNILFPANASGEVYTLLLTTDPHFETELSQGLIGTKADGTPFSYSPIVLQSVITQLADVTITFALTGTSGSYTTGTLDAGERVLVTQSPTVLNAFETSVDWSVKNIANDGSGFGLTIKESGLKEPMKRDSTNLLQSSAPISGSSWYAESTAVVNDTKSDDGGGSTHYNYNLVDGSQMVVGMTITAISAGTLGAAPTLTQVGIGPTGNQIKMSSGKAFADGITLTLKGYGVSVTNSVLGMDVVINNMTITQEPTTTTVRGAVSASTAIDVNGTYGISKGAFIEGFGVDNSVSNPIAAIADPDAAQGQITSTTAQTLADGTTLNILGSSDTFSIKGDITVNSFPSRSVTLYLDLDKFLTLGTAS